MLRMLHGKKGEGGRKQRKERGEVVKVDCSRLIGSFFVSFSSHFIFVFCVSFLILLQLDMVVVKNFNEGLCVVSPNDTNFKKNIFVVRVLSASTRVCCPKTLRRCRRSISAFFCRGAFRFVNDFCLMRFERGKMPLRIPRPKEGNVGLVGPRPNFYFSTKREFTADIFFFFS